jgi:hypothetical protein
MAPMWAWGGGRGFGVGALSVILVGALMVGVSIAAVLVPGATGRAAPTVRHTSSPSGPRGSSGSSDAPVSKTSSSVPSTAPKMTSSEFTADPTTEEGVATRLIAAIDAGSGGRFSIRATLDNIGLLDTWMDNEGGLWANNPLNTSLDAVRYPDQITTTGEDTHIPIYPDIQIGIDATATTLLSDHVYSGILWMLNEGTAPCRAFASVVMASPWAASHYGDDGSRFCGASGGSGPPGSVLSACLRLPDGGGRVGGRHRGMPGACGRPASGVRTSHGGHGQRRQRKTTVIRVRPHHRRASSGAASRRRELTLRPSPVRHGTAISRRR